MESHTNIVGDEEEHNPLRELDEAVLVLGDIYHAMARVKPADKSWPLALDFCREFSDAIFDWNATDMELLTAVAAKKGLTFDAMLKKDRRYVLERIRRQVPGPEILATRLRAFFDRWKHQKHSNQRVFDDKMWKTMDGIVKLAQDGYLSDPPNLQLYTRVRVDADKLPVWRCNRGTNVNESVHNKLREALDLENCSVELSDLLLQYFVDVFNQRSALRNIPGTIDHRHFDTGLIDKINTFAEELTGKPLHPTHRNNSGLHLHGEKVGVTRIYRSDPSEGLPKVIGDPSAQMKGDAGFIARMTGTRVPPLPLQTKEEFALYDRLHDETVREMEGVDPQSSKFCEKLLEKWNENVDGCTIFMKTVAHLRGRSDKLQTKRYRQILLEELRGQGHELDSFRTYRDFDEGDFSSSSSDNGGSDHGGPPSPDPDRAEAIARSTAPGPIPIVPSAILRNTATPTATLQATVPPPVPQQRSRTCQLCQQPGCPGHNSRERCTRTQAATPAPSSSISTISGDTRTAPRQSHVRPMPAPPIPFLPTPVPRPVPIQVQPMYV